MCLLLNIIQKITTLPRHTIPPLMVFLYVAAMMKYVTAFLLALTVSEHSSLTAPL